MKLLLLSVILSLISISIACKCIVPVMEKQFCSTEYSVKIKVNSGFVKSGELGGYYEVEVLEVYKSDEKARKALELKRIYTAKDSAACGRVFEKNSVYIITGNVEETKAQTHSCTFGKNVNDLTDVEKKFFETEFKTVACN